MVYNENNTKLSYRLLRKLAKKKFKVNKIVITWLNLKQMILDSFSNMIIKRNVTYIRN
jgi:hypothetical protein